MSKQDELDNVINLFTNHFITYLNYPPLASKIYAILLVSYREKGISFKEIIQITNSSKSSVSTSLNFLKNVKKLTYYVEKDSRKKFFKAITLVDVISSYARIFNSEKKATIALESFIKKYEADKYENFKKEFFDLYIEHINKVQKLLKESEQGFNKLYKKFEKIK